MKTNSQILKKGYFSTYCPYLTEKYDCTLSDFKFILFSSKMSFFTCTSFKLQINSIKLTKSLWLVQKNPKYFLVCTGYCFRPLLRPDSLCPLPASTCLPCLLVLGVIVLVQRRFKSTLYFIPCLLTGICQCTIGGRST